MAKNISPKTALSNAFVELRARLEEIEPQLAWQSWDQATEQGYALQKKLIRRRDQISLTITQLEEHISRKRERKDGRKAETGSRLLLCICPECEYRMRVSFMCITRAIPTCPDKNCGMFQEPMDHEEPESYNPDKAREYDLERYHANAIKETYGEVKEERLETFEDTFADLPGAGDLSDIKVRQ